MKKFLVIVLCFVISVSLFGCAPQYTAPVMTFTAAGATGYEWQCTVDDEAVAEVEGSTEAAADIPGASVNYNFSFTAVAAGETTAVFAFGRSWENARMKCECSVTVDEELHASLGELSENVLEIDMDSPDYEVICFDSDVVTVRESEDSGLFTFTAVQSGTTRVDFFYMPDAEDEDSETEEDTVEEFTDRAYEITVDEAGMFYWMEVEADESGDVDMGLTDYTSAKELASDTGLFVPECKQMKSCQYAALTDSGLATVQFKWDEISVIYAAGYSSPDTLTDGTTVEKTIADTTVYITSGKDTDAARTDVTAAWEYDGGYCCIASEDPDFTEELIETILTAILEAQSAE